MFCRPRITACAKVLRSSMAGRNCLLPKSCLNTVKNGVLIAAPPPGISGAPWTCRADHSNMHEQFSFCLVCDVWCPPLGCLIPPDTLKGGHQTRNENRQTCTR